MPISPPYYTRLAAAYVRGKLRQAPICTAVPHLFVSQLDSLAFHEQEELVQLGLAHGLRLHRFKQTMGLPRVQKVLGMLRGIQPPSLLDIGSGRGAFLWPLLDAFPTLPVTASDILPFRVASIQAVCDGGLARLTAVQADATALDFAEGSFDVVTMVEVLEHIPAYQQALAEVCRVARRFVVLSVPSKPDDNPEHLHLFNEQMLADALQPYAARVSFDYVHNHMLIVVRLPPL